METYSESLLLPWESSHQCLFLPRHPPTNPTPQPMPQKGDPGSQEVPDLCKPMSIFRAKRRSLFFKTRVEIGLKWQHTLIWAHKGSTCFHDGLEMFYLPGWVNFSHRNWFPPEMPSAFPPLGQNRVTTSFLRLYKISLFFQNRKYINSMKISGVHFLFYDYYLPYSDESTLTCPFIWPPTLGNEFVLKHQQ